MSIVGAFTVPHPPIIISEIGHGREKEISKTQSAYIEVAKKIASIKPETIIVISPHSTAYLDYFHISKGDKAFGNFADFGANNVSVSVAYDEELVKAICREAKESKISSGTDGEKNKLLDHATCIPLYFINKFFKDYKLVRISLSGASYKEHYRFGKCIQRAIEKINRRTVIVASGDLSHVLKESGPYGFNEAGPKYDERVMRVLESGKFLELLLFDNSFCEAASECGHRSFVILAGILDSISVISKKLSYEAPFGVGYGICEFEIVGKDSTRNFLEQYEKIETEKLSEKKQNEDEYVRLARESVETFVKTKNILKVRKNKIFFEERELNNLVLSDEICSQRKGVFVSIKKEGLLRGCIGTIYPTCESVAEEIISNAISASSYDTRFYPIEEDELNLLSYNVDVLFVPEKISSKAMLDVKKYGVIVTKGNRRGLLLPNLDNVDSVDMQIEIACKKAGIEVSENPELERFEVVRHF